MHSQGKLFEQGVVWKQILKIGIDFLQHPNSCFSKPSPSADSMDIKCVYRNISQHSTQTSV
jgi:hypothetical protein